MHRIQISHPRLRRLRWGRHSACPHLAILLLQAAASAATQSPAYETVVLSDDSIQFKLQGSDKEEFASMCPLDVCTCDSDIEYVRLLPPSHSAARFFINRQLKSHATGIACQYLDATASMKQEVTNLSAATVSVVELSYSQRLGSGGSCHGGSAVHTYDLATGKEYRLADIIDKSSLTSLRKSMPASIVAEHDGDNPDQDLKAAREAVKSVGDQQLLESLLFVKEGRVFINVAGYYFGCVGGIFHPAEIPASQITPAMRHKLIGP